MIQYIMVVVCGFEPEIKQYVQFIYLFIYFFSGIGHIFQRIVIYVENKTYSKFRVCCNHKRNEN